MTPRPRKISATIFAVPGTVLAQDTSAHLNPDTASLEEPGAVAKVTPGLVTTDMTARTSGFDAQMSRDQNDAEKSAVYEILFSPIDLNEATSEEIAGLGSLVTFGEWERRGQTTQHALWSRLALSVPYLVLSASGPAAARGATC